MNKERTSKMSNLENEKTQVTLKGEKPKLKGAFRCTKCGNILVDINQVSFKPISLGNKLKEHGYNYVCLNCKTAFAREERKTESTETESEYKCEQCNKTLYKLIAHNKLVGYYCINCKLLYKKEELEKQSKTSQNKTTEKDTLENLNFVCPQCEGDVQKTKSGKYRCPKCRMLFEKKELKKGV